MHETRSKNEWAITEAMFNTLLQWLHHDREEAAKKYEVLRTRLMKFFERRGCQYYEEYTDETFLRVIRKIHQGEKILTENHYLYFHGVARNVLREHWRNAPKDLASIDDLSPSLHPRTNPIEVEQQDYENLKVEKELECLQYCLDKLSSESREIIIAYHTGEQGVRIANREKLANRLGVALNTLRVRAHRLRETLEKCVNDCIKRL